jgi:hypothetical protein
MVHRDLEKDTELPPKSTETTGIEEMAHPYTTKTRS